MIAVQSWLEIFCQALRETFGARVWFVGLQGSYGRGEAADDSDIDVVVILDALTRDDPAAYRAMLSRLPARELICGFFAGKDELLHWDAADLFQFYYDTRPIQGSLDTLLLLLDDAAVERAIRGGACNLYHGCMHNLLHERSEKTLCALYRAARFVAQAICFRQTGAYAKTWDALLRAAGAEEQAIVRTALALRHGEAPAFDAMSEALLFWARRWIVQT